MEICFLWLSSITALCMQQQMVHLCLHIFVCINLFLGWFSPICARDSSHCSSRPQVLHMLVPQHRANTNLGNNAFRCAWVNPAPWSWARSRRIWTDHFGGISADPKGPRDRFYLHHPNFSGLVIFISLIKGWFFLFTPPPPNRYVG